MKNKIYLIIIISFFIFCFLIFFKGLDNQSTYIPKPLSKKILPNFISQTLYQKKQISSEQIFIDSDYYLINIWASWCVPCKQEHQFLMELKKNTKIKLIGLNYKDNLKNAKSFIDEMGNPYSQIITDRNGTISIELGAYGIPETLIIDKNNIVIRKFIGPLTNTILKDIELLIK